MKPEAGRRRSSPLAATAGLASLVLLAACAPAAVPPLAPVPATVLRPGMEESRVLARGESARYRVPLAAGDVLHLRIEQQGLDIEIRFPRGEAQPVDHPHGGVVSEELWWLAEPAQELWLEVRALGPQTAPAGAYHLRVEALGPADGAARRRCRAFWTARRGMDALAAGQPMAARELLTTALAAWERAEAPLQEAIAWAALAAAQAELEDPQAALRSYDSALARAASSRDDALRGRVLLARGSFYRRQWLLEPAETDFLAARDHIEAVGDTYAEALIANDLAVLQGIRGELAAACDGFDRAHRLFGAAGFERQSVQALVKWGSCLLEVGDLPEALPRLLDGLAAAERIENNDLEVLALREVGWWYRLNGEPKTAQGFLQRALALAPEDAGVHDRLATAYTDDGAIELGRRHYLTALELVVDDPLESAYVRANLCRLEERAGNTTAALEQCARSAPTLEELGADAALAHVLLLGSQLERRAGRLEEAEALAAQVVALIEAQRPFAGEHRLRSAFLAERLEPHRQLIDLRMALHRRHPGAGWDARALEAAELTRERGLLDLLRAERVDPALRANPRLKREEDELLRRIERLARHQAALLKISGQPHSDLRSQQLALAARLAAVQGRLRREDPSYAALSRPQAPDLEEVRRQLDSETLMLVYHLSGDAGYVWTVSRDAVNGRALADPQRLQRLAAAWYRLLSNADLLWVEPERERARAEALSAALLGPVAGSLAGRRRLVVVADGYLGRIPFAALPWPTGPAGAGETLGAHFEVVGLPSAAVLPVLRRQNGGRRPAAGLLAMIADPVYEPDDDRLTAPPSGDRPRRSQWPRLHGSRLEARDLRALTAGRPTRFLEGFEARRARVLGGALHGYRIVTFATHARTGGRASEATGLLLSLYDARGRRVEGWLGLPELYALDLPAELAVLSACGTALGEEVPGDGLVGLTRGFMHAGTPRLLVSLWAVRDRASRELVRRFFAALLGHGAPTAALQDAQQSMWRDGWPVRDWAAYTLQGDWRPFSVTTGDNPQPLVSSTAGERGPSPSIVQPARWREESMTDQRSRQSTEQGDAGEPARGRMAETGPYNAEPEPDAGTGTKVGRGWSQAEANPQNPDPGPGPKPDRSI